MFGMNFFMIIFNDFKVIYLNCAFFSIFHDSEFKVVHFSINLQSIIAIFSRVLLMSCRTSSKLSKVFSHMFMKYELSSFTTIP